MNYTDAFNVLIKKRSAILIPIILTALSFGVVSLLPKIYYTEVRLKVTESSNSMPLQLGINKSLSSMLGASKSNDENILFFEILQGRENLTDAIHKFDLGKEYKRKSLDLTLKDFMEDLSMGETQDNIIFCGLLGKNRERIIEIATYLVENANKKYMKINKTRMQLNTKFLREKKDQVFDSIQILNGELVSFYKANNIVNIESQIELSVTALSSFEKVLVELQQEKAFIQKSTGIASPEVLEITGRIDALLSEIQSLRSSKLENYKPSKNSLLINPEWALDNISFERTALAKISILKDVLTYTSKELALLEAEVSKEIPIVQIIQSAYYPDWKIKPKRITTMIIVFLASAIGMTIYLIWRSILNGEIRVANIEKLKKFESMIIRLFSWK